MNKKVNILFVTHYAEMYGANQSMLQLIIELTEKHSVAPIVLLPRSGSICEKLKANNIPYLITHYYWWVNDNHGLFQFVLNWRKQFINYLKLPKVINMLDSYSIDLIYSNSIVINEGALLAKKMKKPHLWCFRESLDSYNFKLSIGTCLSKRFLRNAANKYVLISDYLINFYKNLLPLNKTERVYNGIAFSATPTRVNKVCNVLNICMIGVISEQKNNLDALKALKILKDQRISDNIFLHFIGLAREDYLSLLKKYIDDNNLQEHVKFHGHQSNVNKFLLDMNLGIMCSRNEAFGRVTVEYMMHQMPVIASNSGANAEIVANGTGFLYEIYNEHDLAEKIARFVKQPELIETMGEQAYSYAKENFSSEKSTEGMYKIILRILDKK